MAEMMDSNNVEVEVTGHPNKVLEGLNSLRLKNIFCDVILCSGGKEFPCHRSVLASFSNYFQALFTTGLMESKQHKVEINGVEPEMIDILVYAYTAKVVISTTNVQAMLAAANFLDIVAVKKACCRYMERHMEESNCVGIHCFAEAHSCETLEKRSMDYILEHFGVIYQQEEFLSLPVEKLTEILAGNHLYVPKEDMVFEAAMLWLNQCPSRKQSIEKVLERIHVPLISPSYLPIVIKSLDVVKEFQSCQKFISEAKEQAAVHRSTVMVMVGGATEERPFLHRVMSFNPLTKQWKTLGNVPFNIKNFGVAASGRGADLYLAGGRFPDGSYSRDMWRYDPYHYSWLKLAPMNVARCDLSLVMLDGFVYAVGSDVEGDDDQPLMECYNPRTNTWHCIEGSPEYDLIHAVVALDGLLYVYGDLAYTYNPKTSVWTQVAPIPNERHGFGSSACTLNGKIYVLGLTGLDWHRRKMCKVLCYDPETNEWTSCADLVKGRGTPGVAVVEGKMYVAGGKAVGRYHPIERYCEDTDTWYIVGEMPTGFSSQCCVSLSLHDYILLDD